MDEINPEDASQGVLDYFWDLNRKLSAQERKIRRQRKRIEILEADGLSSIKAKALKNQVDQLQFKIDNMEAKYKRIVDAEKYYRYKMETIVHRLGIKDEVRSLRKQIGKELKETLGDDWGDDGYKAILQAEIPWQVE